jgi:hypothetical protein
MTVHRCSVLLSCLCAFVLFACWWLVYLRLLTSLLGGLDNALVSLCVWNAGSKYHAPDMALAMFEGLLLLCFHLVSFYFTIILYYITSHFMHPQYDRSSLCCAVILLVCCLLVCMLACWCICDC